ncbi:MAG: CotS family spore coat protein [Firmicutes bacterium]|nr:CotS family spore coat protein [Bacillota bacterium]
MMAILAAAKQFGINPIKTTQVRRAFKVQGEEGVFAIKESRQTEADILFIHAAKEYLYQQNMTNLDRYVLTPEGSPYADVSGRLFVVSPWVESREADYGSLKDGTAAASCLARLHKKSCGFTSELSEERNLWGLWPSMWQERLVRMDHYKTIAAGQSVKNSFDRRFLRNIDEYTAQGQEALKLLETTQYRGISAVYAKRGGICHHDYSERNVLFTPKGTIHLVDFDYCISDIPVHDLVNFLRRTAKYNNYNAKATQQILETYLEENPLSKPELALFVPLWLWPQKFWEVVHQFYGENRRRPRSRYTNRLKRRCRLKNKELRLLEEIVRSFALS